MTDRNLNFEIHKTCCYVSNSLNQVHKQDEPDHTAKLVSRRPAEQPSRSAEDQQTPKLVHQLGARVVWAELSSEAADQLRQNSVQLRDEVQQISANKDSSDVFRKTISYLISLSVHKPFKNTELLQLKDLRDQIALDPDQIAELLVQLKPDPVPVTCWFFK
ncbi:Calponiny domain containing protein [Dorcoceras hygrometricum]|uniref:Calponiny domain containing protein n=1 Tax=Dorcoceras hygrometricum TaxID=472368 RepID=A0A2Z7D2I8_9LAMI|nr:Calponiny domain containing protein [Dorcoceras hygrometricum]